MAFSLCSLFNNLPYLGLVLLQLSEAKTCFRTMNAFSSPQSGRSGKLGQGVEEWEEEVVREQEEEMRVRKHLSSTIPSGLFWPMFLSTINIAMGKTETSGNGC